MEKFIAAFVLIFCMATSHAQNTDQHLDTVKAKKEILRLYDIEEQLVLKQDTTKWNAFYPDDFIVTNPFGNFIDKKKVIERVSSNIIKYKSYKRTFDAFRFYGETAIVIGSEVVVPTADADRTDAGDTVNRRFTEVWLFRNRNWQKVVRHASNVPEK